MAAALAALAHSAERTVPAAEWTGHSRTDVPDGLLTAIPEIRPLSKTDPESVTEVTKWLDSHTKPAGNGHSTSGPLNGNGNALKRRVTV